MHSSIIIHGSLKWINFGISAFSIKNAGVSKQSLKREKVSIYFLYIKCLPGILFGKNTGVTFADFSSAFQCPQIMPIVSAGET